MVLFCGVHAFGSNTPKVNRFRQTDRQTHVDNIYHASIASRGKNMVIKKLTDYRTTPLIIEKRVQSTRNNSLHIFILVRHFQVLHFQSSHKGSFNVRVLTLFSLEPRYFQRYNVELRALTLLKLIPGI